MTRRSQRYSNWRILTLGALFYALGAGSVVLGRGFGAFWLSMVILTIGELLLVPTGTAMAANLAPAGHARAVHGPLRPDLGRQLRHRSGDRGLLNDNVAPVAIWVFALAAGLAATAGFLLLRRKLAERPGYAGPIATAAEVS